MAVGFCPGRQEALGIYPPRASRARALGLAAGPCKHPSQAVQSHASHHLSPQAERSCPPGSGHDDQPIPSYPSTQCQRVVVTPPKLIVTKCKLWGSVSERERKVQREKVMSSALPGGQTGLPWLEDWLEPGTEDRRTDNCHSHHSV